MEFSRFVLGAFALVSLASCAGTDQYGFDAVALTQEMTYDYPEENPRTNVPDRTPTYEKPKAEAKKPCSEKSDSKSVKTAQVNIPDEARCGSRGDKVLVCQVPGGNADNAHTICVSVQGAVNGHVSFDGKPNQDGDYLGECKVES